MSVVWKINGTEFKALGLSGLKRQLRSLAPDLVTFAAEGTAYDAADLTGLAIGDDVTITHTVGATTTQWFTGKVTRVPRIGAPEGEALTYEITGPWWYLDNLIYRQNYPLDATTNPGVPSPATHRRAAAIIGQGSTGARETNVATQTDILDWCIAQGAAFTRGTLPTGYYVPYIGLTAPTCAEALRSTLKWMPDAASRFDYTATPPVISVVRRGDASATTIDLAAEPGLRSISLTPRPDLKIDHVVIQAVSVSSTNTIVVDEDVDPPGSTGREFGSIVIPIPAAAGDVLFSGLAANWRSALSTLQYQGRLTFEEEDCLRTLRPGDVINLTNGVTAWATMRAQIASIAEDIDAGTTEYELGPPEHLNVQDLTAQVLAARWQNLGLLAGATLAEFRDPANSGVENPGASSGVFDDGDFSGDVSIVGNLHVFGAVQIDGTTNLGDLIAASATIGGWDIDGTFFAHDGRLDAAESDIFTLDGRLDAAESAITTLDGRLDAAESAITTLDGRLDAVESDITALDGRLDTVEFDLPALESRVTITESEIVSLGEIDDAIIADIETVFDTVNGHTVDIAALDTRIAALEAFFATISELELAYCGGTSTFLVV